MNTNLTIDGLEEIFGSGLAFCYAFCDLYHFIIWTRLSFLLEHVAKAEFAEYAACLHFADNLLYGRDFGGVIREHEFKQTNRGNYIALCNLKYVLRNTYVDQPFFATC
jgi:hypothetical protein